MTDTSKYLSPLVSCLTCKKEYSAKGIFTHFFASHTEAGKEKYMTNGKIFGILGASMSKQKANIKEINYCKNPNLCICGSSKSYKARNNKYCSASCGAHFANKNKGPVSEITKEKIGRAICKHNGSEYKIKDQNKIVKHNPILSAIKTRTPFTFIKYCTCCGNCFNASNRPNTTTCSDECYIYIKTVKNAGGRKSKYKEIIFDSLWEIEIAKLLDELSILWSRPKNSLLWISNSGKTHKYFPDFFLPDHNIFLDPKNPIVMIKQKEKVDYILSNYKNVIIGNLLEIKTYILNLGASDTSRTCMYPANLSTRS